MFTADTRFHKAGDVVVTPVSIDTYAKTGLQFTVYSEAVMGHCMEGPVTPYIPHKTAGSGS